MRAAGVEEVDEVDGCEVYVYEEFGGVLANGFWNVRDSQLTVALELSVSGEGEIDLVCSHTSANLEITMAFIVVTLLSR